MKNPEVSIVIPARNEADSLPLLLKDLGSVIPECGCDVEVIVVDDDSDDDTTVISEASGAIVVRNHGKKHGKGAALKCGFRDARGKYIVMMDADYSHRAEDLPLVLDLLRQGCGLVIASRTLGGSDEYTHLRAFGNILLSGLLSILFRTDIRDALNGFKGFRRELAKNFNYRANHFDIEVELVANALRSRYRIAEVASHERARHGGECKSQVIRHGLYFLFRILLEAIKYPLPSIRRAPNHSSGN